MTEEASSTVGGTSSVDPSTVVTSSCSTQDKALLKARLIQKHVQSKTPQQMLEINIQESLVSPKQKTGKAEQRHCMTEWKQVRKKV